MSGFTREWSAMINDALRPLSEMHMEFTRPLHVAYVDIKAAFVSVDRLSLWRALGGKGVPDTMLKLLEYLYSVHPHRCKNSLWREGVQALSHIIWD